MRLVAKRKMVRLDEPQLPVENIVPASIITQLLKDGAISTGKIEALAVTAAKIAANTITASEIAATTITTSELNFTPYVIGTNTLDDVGDGTSYKRVLTAHLDAGKLKLISTTTVDAGFTVDMIGEGSTNKYFNGKDLDDLGEGTTYQRVLATQISAGKISLTSTSYLINEDGIIAGTAAQARTELTANGIRGYSYADSTATLEFEIKASDGKAYFGAGVCTCDVDGIKIDGAQKYLYFYSGDVLKGKIGIASTYLSIMESDVVYFPDTEYIVVQAGCVIEPDSVSPSGKVGCTGFTFEAGFFQYLGLKEIASTPDADSGFGKLYTKTIGDKLYFQDGAGSEHEVAYAA